MDRPCSAACPARELPWFSLAAILPGGALNELAAAPEVGDGPSTLVPNVSASTTRVSDPVAAIFAPSVSYSPRPAFAIGVSP